jgi:hypothetical protein
MTRFLAAAAAACVLLLPMLAQSAPQSGPNGQTAPGPADCDQIRQAVAQYGYAAARRYAVTHYGKEAANYGDHCLTKKQRSNG